MDETITQKKIILSAYNARQMQRDESDEKDVTRRKCHNKMKYGIKLDENDITSQKSYLKRCNKT